jgi:hypothetical protein
VTVVGLGGTAVLEARDRLRAAFGNTGYEWPDRRVTVSLPPADLPKQGSGFDLSAADVALGDKDLLEAERAFRDLKTTLELRPIHHRLEHRIRAHVLLCWLALLLVRVTERQSAQTWRRINTELGRLHLVTLTGPAGHEGPGATPGPSWSCRWRHQRFGRGAFALSLAWQAHPQGRRGLRSARRWCRRSGDAGWPRGPRSDRRRRGAAVTGSRPRASGPTG